MLKLNKITDLVEELDVKGQDDTCVNHAQWGLYSCHFDCLYPDGKRTEVTSPDR